MNGDTVELTHLASVADELAKCAKCGECRSVCPVFAHGGRERHVARGKLGLAEAVRTGELGLSDAFDEVANNCLLCLACVSNCGSGVRVDRVIRAARADLASHRGLPAFKRLIFRMLAEGRGGMNFLSRSGSLFQYLLFRRIPHTSGLRRRFPLPWMDKDRYLPALSSKPFLSRMSDARPSGDPVDTVLLFTGCSVNYMFPHIAEAVTSVLTKLGVRVIVPVDQMCCGTMADVGGDRETAKLLARKNLSLFTSGELPYKIVTPCSSCGYTLSHGYQELMAGDDQWSEKALNVAERVYDISRYLIQEIGPERIAARLTKPFPGKVTYHDPCHLKRGQGVSAEPRQLLKLACGGGFVEMNEADRCCGSGGLYGLTHRRTSLNILSRKIENMAETEAATAATGCPACLVQLQEGIINSKLDITPLHTIEILDRCLE